MRALCEICGEFYAEVSLEGVTKVDPAPGDLNGRPTVEALKRPLRGSMFGSPDPFHGFPAPFDPSATWEFMFCPYSNRTHRPFIASEEPKQLLTHMGMIEIPFESNTEVVIPDPVADDDFTDIPEEEEDDEMAKAKKPAGKKKAAPKPAPKKGK